MTWLIFIVKKIFRTSRPEMLRKKVLLVISQNSQENTCAELSFLIKSQSEGLDIY